MRLYEYIGPAELLGVAATKVGGSRIITEVGLRDWISAHQRDDSSVTATFTIDRSGHLRLADRRSEHVHCAAGEPVLSAGEITFDAESASVVSVTNQSTGYCPEPGSWPCVEAALRQIGVPHPTGFTSEFIFRKCPECGERNIVRENWFVCAFCDADLPKTWNFSSWPENG
jgi:hypothetical protein